jgi:predicted tellurium resistance membrane protein TerC
MPNVRRFFAVFLSCLVVGALLTGAGEPTGTSTGEELQLKVDRPDANTVDAAAGFRSFRLRSQYGELDVDLHKVHTLTVDKVTVTADRTEVHATAEMSDHSRLSGQLLTTEFPVTVDGKADTLTPVEGLKIKFVHPKSTGLVAALVGLLTLTVMEIVLGIDNIIFLAIVAAKLPEPQQPLARRIGLAAALGTRLLLLGTLWLLVGATRPLFTIPELPFLQDPEARGISVRDLVLLIGGLFLIGKSTKEIREKIEHADAGPNAAKKAASFVSVILQIAIIDIIFSLDSVITAVGMVEELWVMILAMVIAVGVMVAFAEPISRFVDKNPSIKVLALSFLILIGVLLVAEGLGQHVDKGYIYFAMAFAVVIELINMRLRPKPKPKATPGEGI